jgi:spore germination protein YaaH
MPGGASAVPFPGRPGQSAVPLVPTGGCQGNRRRQVGREAPLSKLRRFVAAAALLLLVTGSVPNATIAEDPTPSPGPAAPAQLAPLTPDQIATRPAGDVFGFLPYWEIDDKIDGYLRYDLLSTIAFFGVGLDADGSLITGQPGYKAYLGDTATTIIEHAHAAGVRAVITFEAFSKDRNAAFLQDPDRQALFIQQALALMQLRGADGANFDMENLSGSYFDEYGAFVGAFRRAVVAWNPAAEVTVATNANSSGAKMAAAALANGADKAFIMGYAYRSSGSSPVGSIAPLVRADGGQSLTTTLNTYADLGIPSSKLILGLPFYGTAWPTVSPQLNAERQSDSARGSSGVFFPRGLGDIIGDSTANFDPMERAAVLVRWDAAHASWRQVYYDDPASLAPKMQLALRRGLAGVGIWALGYDRGEPGYWELVDSLHGGLELSHLDVTPFATNRPSVVLSLGWKSAGSAINGVRLSTDWGAWSGWRRPTPRLTWSLGAVADGLHTVSIQIRDASGALATIRPVDVVLDREGPVVASLTLAYSTGPGKWIARYHATDLSGVAAYQFRSRVGLGPWHVLPRGPNATLVRIGAGQSSHVSVEVRAKDILGTWGPWRGISEP